MGLDGHADPGVVPIGPAKLLAEGQARRRRPVIGGRKVVEHFPHHRPDAGFRRGPGHRIAKEVHVGKGSGAGEQHLGDGQLGAPIDEIPVHPGLRRKDVGVEPGFQRQVVGQAPEQGHGGVGVGIDQPGHDQTLGIIQPPFRDQTCLQLRRRPHRHDFFVPQGHRPRMKNLPGLILGQHPIASYQQRYVLFGCCGHLLLIRPGTGDGRPEIRQNLSPVPRPRSPVISSFPLFLS